MNLQRIIEAIRTIDKLLPLGDGVYAVRERELRGWDGPKVTQYSDAVKALKDEGVLE